MTNQTTSIPLHDRIRLIRIQAFFRSATGNPFSLVLGGGLSALALTSVGVPSYPLRVWFALILLLSGLIFAFERFVKRRGLTQENAGSLFRRRVALGLVNAALFGGVIGLVPEGTAQTAYLLVFVVVSAVAALGYMSYATEFRYGLAVSVLTIAPYALFCFYRYFAQGDAFLLLTGIIALVWQAVVVSKALHVSRSAVGEIEAGERLRDEMAGREQVERELRDSQDESRQLATMLRMMCDNVPDMIWAKDLEGRYIFANKALCEKLLGTSDTSAPLGKTFDHFAERERAVYPDQPEWHTYGQFSQDVDRHTLSREEPTIYEESGNVRGSFVFLDVHQARFVSARGEVIGTVGCARDITARKASEAFVHHLAHHDALTDLPNRALLNERLRQALAQVRRDRTKLAVLFIDLDRLKPVNDTLGHDIGDLLLMEVAARLRSVMTRRVDTVARLGGDEFVILLPRINKEQDAEAAAERVLLALRQPFRADQHTIRISASIGVAFAPQHGLEAEALLKSADTAMYCVKRERGDDFRFFDESMQPPADDPTLL
ncbi:MAG: GGDEF domain-containing protein [Propionivibrio sp.]|uniref:sensor domain-containing diguanylate cyclase n=1 Tax=Propionivibrio sp. TaxID=2212460 RepID=UPI001B54B9D8|nr:sensor domain-containing diguanylate cyclase [Propionivibrio sp.]MBP7203417.1 GGDEF domain-containing protein [Propionivibrio sp.]